MAIIENRSTEIGDVLRIQTAVPIVGLVSLTAFSDVTEGENTGGGGSTGATIPPLVDDRKSSNFINSHVFFDDDMFVISRSNDGTLSSRAIARYNLTTEMWDTNYPDSTIQMSGIVYANGFIYGVLFTNQSGTSTVSIRRISITTRAWEDVSLDGFTNPTRLGSRSYTSTVSKVIFDDKIWMIVGAQVVSYDIVTDTYSASSNFVPISNGLTIDTINAIAYLSISPNERLNTRNKLLVYDINANTFRPNTPNNRRIVENPRFFAGDGFIYVTQEDQNFQTNDGRLAAYDPATQRWIDTYPTPVPIERFWNDLEVFNNRVYGLLPDRSLRIFDIPTNAWLEAEPATRFFQKQFRYSLDGGLSFTPFMPLTSINIQNIQIDQRNSFVVDISYERAGTDMGGELVWVNSELSGEFTALGTPIFDTTIFKQLFEVLDPNVLGWAMNVLEKIYQRGLLPDYIERNRENVDDQDFVTYWFSITHLFAILVYWMRNFENIPANRTLLTAFLRNFDITLPFDLNLTDEATIYTQRTDEYRRRGTERIARPAAQTNEDVDGELLRLVNWSVNDFFLFALTESSRFGWCLGLSSPSWTSTNGVTNLIMGYEFTTSVEDLTRYPLVGESNIAIIEDADIGQNVMAITNYAGAGGTFGIDTGTTPADNTFLMPVDNELDYEISFKVKKIDSDPLDITFSAYAYDENRSSINFVAIDGTGLTVNTFQTLGATETTLVEDVYYTFTGVLHATTTAANANLAGNIDNYRGLRMFSNTRYIGVGITVEGDASRSDFYLYDLKIRPKDLPISQGLLGIKNIVVSYMQNEGELSDENTRLFIQNRLIPYNSFLIPRWL